MFSQVHVRDGEILAAVALADHFGPGVESLDDASAALPHNSLYFVMDQAFSWGDIQGESLLTTMRNQHIPVCKLGSRGRRRRTRAAPLSLCLDE